MDKTNSIFTKIGSAIARYVSPFTLIKAGGGLLAVVLLVYGVSSLVFNQLISATTSSETSLSYGGGDRGDLQAAIAPSQRVAPENSLAGDESSLALGQATGLGASDLRVSNPVARVVGAVGAIFNTDEPSYYPEPYYGNPPATDNREFLQLSYRATLRTRKVQEIGRRVQTMVRGYGGRLNSATTEEKTVYISFVVPKDKFEEFKAEVADLVPAKFLTESINSQNLLPQKRVIEENTVATSESLDKLTANRAALVAKHNTRVKSLNASLSAINKAIAALEAESSVTTNTVRLAEIKAELSKSYQSLSSTRTALNSENSQFNRELASLDNQIEYTKNNLKNLAKQDTALIDTVETVRGTISLRWISLRGILGLYIPGEWQAIIIGLAIIGWIIHSRRRSPAGIQPVQ